MMKVASATGCVVRKSGLAVRVLRVVPTGRMLGVTNRIGQAHSLAILCLCILASSAAAERAANPGSKDFDSEFVDMVVPERVLAHEVFPVTITVRNTGTQAWEGWPVRLRSVHPPNHRIWGTDYILIAQGTAVKAGETYTFRSYLKAPARR
jgi:hypothetical protein